MKEPDASCAKGSKLSELVSTCLDQVTKKPLQEHEILECLQRIEAYLSDTQVPDAVSGAS